MSGVTIQIPQLNIVLHLPMMVNEQRVFNNLSTIQTLKGIINANNVFTTALRNAGLRAGINYTLTNNQTNTLITQDNATLSDLGIGGGKQWPKITLKILNGGGRKSSTRRRRRSSKRRIRRKKRTRKRRTKRRSRRRHTRRKRKKGKC